MGANNPASIDEDDDSARDNDEHTNARRAAQVAFETDDLPTLPTRSKSLHAVSANSANMADESDAVSDEDIEPARVLQKRLDKGKGKAVVSMVSYYIVYYTHYCTFRSLGLVGWLRNCIRR